MRRLVLAALLATLFLVGQRAIQPVLAVTYASGWNLVSGPQGSTLTGASGSIFTLQPGDTDYEIFPATTPLHGGWGYWAFFPAGGSIIFTASAPSLTITPVPGQFIMLGNPSQSVATVTGTDSLLLYTPSGGYQNATAIPPGQGAWVTGNGRISLSAAVDSAPVAAPPIAVATAPAAPAQVAPAATGSSPASDLVGQSVTGLCSIISATSFSARVEQAAWAKSLAGVASSGMWVTVVANVTNTGSKKDSTFLTADLVDDRGRTFEMADTSIGQNAYAQIRDQLGARDSFDGIQPGLSARVLWLYEVPSNVQRLRVVSDYSPCPR